MKTSAEAMADQSDIDDNERIYDSLHYHEEGETKERFLEQFDTSHLELYKESYPAAKHMVHAADNEVIRGHKELHQLLDSYVLCLEKETKEKQKRMTRYRKALSFIELDNRNEEMSFEKARLVTL